MIVGVIRFDVRLHGVQSLKQKRSVIKRLLHQLRSSFPVSMAEVGYADLLQRSILGASMTSTSESLISSVFRSIETKIEAAGTVDIVDTDVEYIHYGEKFS